MPCWCEVYVLSLLAALLANAWLSISRREPGWLILVDALAGVGLVLLVWAYWIPPLALALGIWCVPIFLFALTMDAFEANRAAELMRREAAGDAARDAVSAVAEEDVQRLTWGALLASFAFLLPAYVMAGLLSMQQTGLR